MSTDSVSASRLPLCGALCETEAVAHYVGEGDVEAAAGHGEARHGVLPRGPRADERDQVDAAQHRLALEQHVEHALLRRREKVLRLRRRPPVGQGGQAGAQRRRPPVGQGGQAGAQPAPLPRPLNPPWYWQNRYK